MAFEFRQALRTKAKPLIGLYAESGAGKTYSALLLARGFVGEAGKIGMIETEAGRGEAYADLIPGGYSVVSLAGDFSPTRYGEAIAAAEKAGVDALIIDSASHEWEGVGGVLDMAATGEREGKKGPLVWQKPKLDHARQFMLRLLQTPIPLVIVCMRAKYPMIQTLIEGKKTWVRSEMLEPTQSADILFEMFVHGWIDREHRLHVTKLTRPDLARVFREGEPITLETGKALAAWSQGSADDRTPSSPPLAGASPASAANLQGSRHEAGELPPDLKRLDDAFAKAASFGLARLREEVLSADTGSVALLRERLETIHKPAAREVSEQRKRTKA
jgi:hypothetical protein